jgi:chemosensory pili system protein ChpA (sensor histidine kinase/response regulator)
MPEPRAVGGLKWVKGELIESLRRVRTQLEALIANGGQEDCHDAISALYEVRGVLSALELVAPARLAEEMQRLLEGLAAGSLSNRDEAAEALMLALIQLPNYLDRLEAGHADPPVVLLPSINDLRVSRGTRPLKAAELLAPSPALAGEQTPTPEVLSSLAAVVAKVRPHYHRYLLQVFQGESGQGLVGLGRIFNQLHRFFDHGVFCDAFRAADAMVAGILSGGIPLAPASKALLGHVDTIFKPVLSPDPAWPAPQARHLIDELLTVLTGFHPAAELVAKLQGRYAAPAETDEPPDLEEPTQRSTVGLDALGSLAEEVLRELAGVEDRLDLFVRGGAEDPEQLGAIEASLRQLANTLAIGDQPDSVRRLHGLADEIRGVARGETKADDAFLMGFARDLLAVEDALRRVAPAAEAGVGDVNALLGVTLREARVDLAKAKQAISDYALEPGDLTKLGDVPHMLPGVAAALHMLGEDAAAGVVDQVGVVLRQRLGTGGWVPTPSDLDLLAEAISGVDLYMEGEAQGASFGNHLLTQARGALDALSGGQLAGLGPEPVSPLRAAAATESPVTAAPAARPAEAVATGEAQSWIPWGTEAAAASSQAGTQLDPEFLGIFLEEAREEQERIDEALRRWSEDPADRESLATLRRSFHTLKGSGRLVGATRLAEVAALTESLLDQVLNGVVVPSRAVVEQVLATASALPGLLEAEAEAGAQPADIARVPDGAASLLAPPTLGLAATEAPVGGPEVAAASPAEEPAEADSELLDIYVAEARGHLDTLTGFLDQAGSTAEPRGDPGTLRALHTLSGSSRMAGIDSIAGVSRALDQLFAELDLRGLAVDPAVQELLGRACEGIAERLNHLPHAGPEIASLAELALEAADWTERLAAGPPAPAAHPERGLDTLPDTELLGLSDLGPAMPAAAAMAPETPAKAEPELVGFESPLEAGLEPIALESPAEVELAAEVAAESEAEPQPEPAAVEVEAEAVAFEPIAESEPVALKIAADAQSGLVAEQIPPDAELAAGPPPVTAAAPDLLPVGERAAPQRPAGGVQAELAALFLEDAREILDQLDDGLRRWQLAPLERAPLDAIQRRLHTLKGSARLSGLLDIGDLSHALEAIFTAVNRGELAVTDDTLELAQRSLDALSDQVDAVEQGLPVPVASDLIAALAAPLEAGLTPTAPVAAAPVEPVPAAAEAAPTAARPPAAAPAKAPATPAAQIRVRADLLNRLVNNAAEISIYRGRLGRQNSALGFSLAELDRTVARLREQLRQLDLETEAQILYRFERDVSDAGSMAHEFDPLELDRFSTLQQRSRSITETVNDLVSVKNLLADLQRETADLLVQQERIAGDVQDGLLRARMVPFVQIVPRLQRLVRQTAETLGKRAALDVRNPEVELDRGILDRLGAPLEHLLRNALAHGIEDPRGRQAAGKDDDGAIQLTISREGNDVLISLKDDGAGMDLDAIRRRALERGLLQSGVPATEEELLQLTMTPGFSTVERVTQIAGRGVGLDVVTSEVKRLSGTVTLTSKPGRGTEFLIRLPLTLAIIDAVLVNVGSVIHAIPTASIEAVARIGRTELAEYYKGSSQVFEHLGEDYRVMHLGKLLDPAVNPELGEHRWQPLLLVRTADQRLALAVDSLGGTQRILVKALGPQLSSVPWLNGGTILPDGRVAMIIDLLALARSPAVHTYRAALAQVAATDKHRACVMVVDDSLTVRRVTERLLRRQNMDVLTAKDGVEALTMLEDRIPDLMLLDIEMPRMDGYELTRHIRRSPRLEAIPIIMITSRTGEKHRRLAMELGVNRYLGKPYQEAELLDEISAVLMDAPA